MHSSAMERFKRASEALREAHAEIDALKTKNVKVTEELRGANTSFFSAFSQLKAYSTDLTNLRKQIVDINSSYDTYLSTLRSNFDEHSAKTRRVIEATAREKKLLNDQLTVKKIKCTYLTKRLESQTKVLNRLKHENTRFKSGDKAGALTLSCIRCKARKNVIKSLEMDLVKAYASRDAVQASVQPISCKNEDLEKRLHAGEVETVQLRDQLLNVRRNYVELEQELREEKAKNATIRAEMETLAKTNAEAQARLLQQQTEIEIGRTPTEQNADLSTVDLLEQLREELQSKDERLETMDEELRSRRSEQERLNDEVSFFHRRCEDMTLDLEARVTAFDQQQKDLDEARQQNAVLMQLLENLTADVVRSILQ